MTRILAAWICIAIIVGLAEGGTLKDPSRCGDWLPFKDEKCIKIVKRAGQQTQEDAEIICESFSEELHHQSYPRLITIKTEEEQKFFHKFLFVDNEILDHVWLGLKQDENGTDFEWNDGSGVHYTNWAKQNVTDDRHKCVQMESGEGMNGAGQWVRVNCKITNTVVCERVQTWTLETLQNMFLNYKFEQELEMSKAEIKITSLEQKNAAVEKEIKDLKLNPVPIGFIYVQLSNQQPPITLWPQTNWTDVSSSYAGLFLRIVGGNSAPFGDTQESSTTRLNQIEYINGPNNQIQCEGGATLSPDGSWTANIWSGRNVGGYDMCLRFRLLPGEIRPRNQAVKVWQRTT